MILVAILLVALSLSLIANDLLLFDENGSGGLRICQFELQIINP